MNQIKMLTTKELIDCVKSMSDMERQELANTLLTNKPTKSIELGIVAHQRYMESLTKEQREDLERICLT